LTESLRIFDTTTQKNLEFKYTKLRNIHSVNFLTSGAYTHITKNIDVLIDILKYTSNTDLVNTTIAFKNYITGEAATYKTIIELKEYNVAQCLYINTFADLLINWYHNYYYIDPDVLR